jgi:hypothetical protein
MPLPAGASGTSLTIDGRLSFSPGIGVIVLHSTSSRASSTVMACRLATSPGMK